MEVKYFFRNFSPMHNVFTVVYYNDLFPDGFERNIGTPYNDTGTAYLEGDDLHKYVMAHCPWHEFKVCEQILKIDTSYIENLFNKQDPNLV